ncbi:hypothetical protein [Candidatus Tisiphia endosymbiont of Ptychoptera albimana]|jgi:hypothetical protein|uniref:hypothetical protein n=1 Tax=Candidatus Tisiphia endosymbiont of Ptychoptera albimana TaxID=3066260 RepID=UPI001D38CFE2|nr:hypothetical protein [Rickettsia endosymbiont of Sericostoma sp. HW-2014]
MSKKDGDDVSLDSAYGSDDESMAVPNKVSRVAAEKIKDIDALIGRLGKYKETFNVKIYADEILQFNEASMSVIESLGAENFRTSLSDDKIQQFVDTIALNSELCSKFISTDQELDKLKLKVAKTEGALKGFVLPLEERSAFAGKLTNFGLGREEYKIPMEATKEALLKLQGQKLSKVEYADKVVARTMEILNQDKRNFPAEKLQQFENFVRQGNTSLKVKNGQLIDRDDKLSQLDQEEISSAAIKSVDAFIKELETENEKAKNTSPEKGRQLVSQKSMPQQDNSQKVALDIGEQKTKDWQAAKEMVSSTIDESIKQLKLKISDTTAKKIKKNLSQVLDKFDPQFLQKNKTAIITNITHEITQGKTAISELRKEFHIASDKVKKIAQKITEKYAERNNQFIEEKINPLLNAKKDELALRLSTFIQENQISLDYVNKVLGVSEENKITGNAKSLSLTDKQVEHVTVEQLKGLIRVNPVGFNRNLFQEIPDEVKSINVETEKVQQHSFEMEQRQQLEDEGYVSMDEDIQQPEKNILSQNIVQQEQQDLTQRVQRQDITEQVPQEVTNISADNINKQFSEQQEILSKVAEVVEEAVVEKSTASKEQFPIEINPEMTNVNTELAETLSNFIENNAVTVNEMRIILGTEPSLQDGKIQLTAEQAANITGEQWQWFRDIAPTNFEKEFKLAREVQVNNSIEVEKSTGLGVSDNVKEMVLSTQIIHKAIKLVEEGGKRKLDYSQRNKIIEKLSDKLSQLDVDYLKTEEQAIAKTIAKNIKKDASKSLFSNNITVSDKILTKYADDIKRLDGAKSDKFVAKKINEGIYNHQLKDSQIAEKLSQFLTTIFNPESELVKKIKSSEPSEHTTEKIVDIRKFNPKLFDEIMFPKERLTEIAQSKVTSKARFDELTKEGNSSRDSKSFATDILVDVINSVTQKEGKLRVSLKPKEKDKIFSILHSSLSSLDPQYLNVNRQKITQYIADNIAFSGKNEGKDKIFTIDKKTLDKIAVKVMVAHERKSNEFAAEELKTGSMEINEKLVAHQVTNSILKERISKLLATGNINEAANRLGVFNDNKTVDIKNITDKQLTTLKKIDPQNFDETVFPKSDIAKITTKKQEQKQKLFPEIDLKEIDFKGITIKHTIKHIIMDADDKRVQKITTVRNKAKAIENQNQR